MPPIRRAAAAAVRQQIDDIVATHGVSVPVYNVDNNQSIVPPRQQGIPRDAAQVSQRSRRNILHIMRERACHAHARDRRVGDSAMAPNRVWEMSIMNMSAYANDNNNVQKVLVLVDQFSRYCCAKPLSPSANQNATPAPVLAALRRAMRTDDDNKSLNNPYAGIDLKKLTKEEHEGLLHNDCHIFNVFITYFTVDYKRYSIVNNIYYYKHKSCVSLCLCQSSSPLWLLYQPVLYEAHITPPSQTAPWSHPSHTCAAAQHPPSHQVVPSHP